jgi:cholesterol transport system auxiliary component
MKPKLSTALPGMSACHRRRFALAWLLPLGGALLNACSGSLLPQPTPTPARYTLEADGPTGLMQPPAAAWAPFLTVDTPRPMPGHDSHQMLYLRQPQQLESFAHHEWLDTPARMLAPQLVRALQNSGAFRAVQLAPTAAGGGWRLETEFLRLYQDFSQTPSLVRLSLRAVLIDSVTRQALGSSEFKVSVATTGDDPVAGARAAQAAALQLAEAVAQFCAKLALTNRPTPP